MDSIVRPQTDDKSRLEEVDNVQQDISQDSKAGDRGDTHVGLSLPTHGLLRF
jgi:hypothetical protein